MKALAIIFSVLFCLSYHVQAQEISRKYQIVLKDGNILQGKLLEINKTFWVLETESLGIVEVPFDNIKSFEVLDKNQKATENSSKDDKSIENAYNPVAERYLFLPSALPLEARSGSYQANLLLFTGGNYGFSDKFSAGINLFVLPVPFLLSNINFKFSLPLAANVHLALQTNNFISYTAFLPEFAFISNPNLLVTLGDRRKNITLGLGTTFSPTTTTGLIYSSQLQLSATIPLNWRTFLITQNYYGGFDEFSIFSPSLAVRLVRKNMVFDAGIMGFSFYDYFANLNEVVPFPYFGFQMALGRNKTKSYKVKK